MGLAIPGKDNEVWELVSKACEDAWKTRQCVQASLKKDIFLNIQEAIEGFYIGGLIEGMGLTCFAKIAMAHDDMIFNIIHL